MNSTTKAHYSYHKIHTHPHRETPQPQHHHVPAHLHHHHEHPSHHHHHRHVHPPILPPEPQPLPTKTKTYCTLFIILVVIGVTALLVALATVIALVIVPDINAARTSLKLSPSIPPNGTTLLQPYPTLPATHSGTDSLGRVLPLPGDVGPARSNVTVGIFYFIWHTKYVNDVESAGVNPGPFDNTILVTAADGVINNAQWGPHFAFHHWGQSLFGYYLTDDTWLLRRHATMLTDALVDYISIDTSNGLIYVDYLVVLLDTWAQMRAESLPTPCVTFLMIASTESVIEQLYDYFYSQPQYAMLWMEWEGKPLILVNSTEIDSYYWNFFTFRTSNAFSDANFDMQSNDWFGTGPDAGYDRWPWIDEYPQGSGWTITPSVKEFTPVACGGWPAIGPIGRSYDGPNHVQPAFNFLNQTSAAYGHYFRQQYAYALGAECSDNSFYCSGIASQNLPNVIFVTGWNEWMANRWEVGDPEVGDPQPFCNLVQTTGETVFVDEFCQEFSRDIEPMTGGHSDNFYMQLIAFNRWYKGADSTESSSENQTIHTAVPSFTNWTHVTPQYGDTTNDTSARSHPGFGNTGLYYTDNSATDDLCQAQVTTDRTALYFRAGVCGQYWSTSTPRLNLYLQFNGVNSPTTMGYNYRWNATQNMLYIATGSGSWSAVSGGTLVFSNDEIQLHVAIPYAVLSAVQGWSSLEFKFWVGDEASVTLTDPSQFLLWGDAAPNARLNYFWTPYGSTYTSVL